MLRPESKVGGQRHPALRCMVVGVAGEYDALAVWILDIVITVAALTIMAFLGLIMLIASGGGDDGVEKGWKV
jgi:hypothetical protein